MLVLRLLVGQRLQEVVRLDDDVVHLLRYRQHLLHVSHKAVVSLALLVVLENQLRVDRERIQLYILYAVALVQSLAHLHERHEGRQIGAVAAVGLA